MNEILNEINRLLSQLEQDKKLPSNKEVDEGVREVLEHLKGFVGNRRENGGAILRTRRKSCQRKIGESGKEIRRI